MLQQLFLLFQNGFSPLKQVLDLHHKRWIRAEGLSPYWERHLFSHIPGHAKATLKRTRLSKNSTLQKCKESFNDSALARLKSGLKFTELTASHSWTWGFHFLSIYYVPNTRLSAGDKGVRRGEKTGTEPAKTQTGETSCFLPLLYSFGSPSLFFPTPPETHPPPPLLLSTVLRYSGTNKLLWFFNQHLPI